MPSSTIDLPTIEEEPTPRYFNWGDQYMAETAMAIKAYIAMKELDLLREYETLMGRPLVINPF